MKNLVSVVIPVYNVEEYLIRCINSVLLQDYRNLEIILVDDGSTDRSGVICDEFKNKDNRIHVIHQVNKGLSGARNSGINVASGDYICFIDSDDYVGKEFISTLLSVQGIENSDIVICSYVKGTDSYYKFPKKSFKTHSVTSVEALKSWHGKHKNVETIACNKLYRSKLFENGIRYPEGMFFEDVLTTHRLVSEGNIITFINAKLYYYYQRSNSICSRIDDSKIRQRLETQSIRAEWFLQNGYSDTYSRLRRKYIKHLMLSYCLADSVEYKESILREFKKKTSEEIHPVFTDLVMYFIFFVSHELVRNYYRAMINFKSS